MNRFISDSEDPLTSLSNNDEDERANPDKRLMGKLYIRAVEARDLAAKDITGKSDPYVIISIGEHKLRTTTIAQNLNPVWNEEFSVTNFEVKILLYDEDLFKYDDFLGRVSIPATEVNSGELVDKWYRLLPRKSQEVVKGDVHLQLRYTPEVQESYHRITSVRKILTDKYTSQYFLRFLQEEEYSEETLMVYWETERFQTKVTELATTTIDHYEESLRSIYEHGKFIIETFVVPDAKYEVNFELDVKREYMELLPHFESYETFLPKFGDSAKLEGMFELANAVAFHILETDAFPRFVKSSMFKELLKSIQWVKHFLQFKPEQKIEVLHRLCQSLPVYLVPELRSIVNNRNEQLKANNEYSQETRDLLERVRRQRAIPFWCSANARVEANLEEPPTPSINQLPLIAPKLVIPVSPVRPMDAMTFNVESADSLSTDMSMVSPRSPRKNSIGQISPLEMVQSSAPSLIGLEISKRVTTSSDPTNVPATNNATLKPKGHSVATSLFEFAASFNKQTLKK